MARLEYNGRAKGCLYKRTTLIVCSINIVLALYVLESLCTSLYIYPYDDSLNVLSYTPDQIRKMEETIQIRKASEPLELIRVVKQIKELFSREERRVELPQTLKQKIIDEILQRLRGLNSSNNATEQRAEVANWRIEKLEEAKKLTLEKTLNYRKSKEAAMVAKALESKWDEFLEEIGIWTAIEFVNKADEDELEDEEEFGNKNAT